MKRFFDVVRDMPSTNVRIFVGIGLAVVYVLGSMFGSFLIGLTVALNEPGEVPLNILPNADVHQWLGIFILVMLGIDTTQFAVKRITSRPDVPGASISEVKTETTVETRKEVGV